MRSRILLVLSILGVLAFSTFLMLQIRDQTGKTQEQAKKKQEQPASAPKMPPDQEAFYATYRIQDPEKKIEALEKFIANFPDSSQTGSAKREIFKATVKNRPKEKGRILDAANRMIKPPSREGETVISNIPEYQFIAKELFAAGILLDEAEDFALKSLKYFNKENFIEGLKKSYAEWKRPLPSAELIDRRFLTERAAYRTTLGRIYMKEGKTDEGEKILKDAYAVDPLSSQAALGLAEIAEKKGDNAIALDYLTTAALTAGYAMADVRSKFESLYRKTHMGSLDGMEESLDVRYQKLFPNSISAEQYKSTAARSNRVVLAEFFTGAG